MKTLLLSAPKFQSRFTQLGRKPYPKASLRQSREGFTIIELMIATSVFAIVLLLCTTAMLQIGRIYYKGITTAKTQDTARQIMDDISRSMQFQGGTVTLTSPTPPASGSLQKFCIGDKQYSFLIDRQQNDTPTSGSDQRKHVLVVDNNAPACPAAQTLDNNNVALTSTSRELLASNMRVAKLEIKNPARNLYEINLRIVYGDVDLLNSAHDNCQNVQAGTQFCAVSELRTVVSKRVN